MSHTCSFSPCTFVSCRIHLYSKLFLCGLLRRPTLNQVINAPVKRRNIHGVILDTLYSIQLGNVRDTCRLDGLQCRKLWAITVSQSSNTICKAGRFALLVIFNLTLPPVSPLQAVGLHLIKKVFNFLPECFLHHQCIQIQMKWDHFHQ